VILAGFTSYKALKAAKFVDGFDYQWTVNVKPAYTVSTKGDADGCSSKQLANCPQTPATWDNGDTIDISGTIPAGVAFPAGETPATVEFRMCFAVPSTLDRKWRKFNELFKVCSSAFLVYLLGVLSSSKCFHMLSHERMSRFSTRKAVHLQRVCNSSAPLCRKITPARR
jgi:hypothetical protein